jgi:hypothetical protein
MESLESHKAGFPPFPRSLEIPSGLPHSHGLDDEIRYSETTKDPVLNPDLSPYHRKGLVTDVPGPKCNGCSGTLRRHQRCDIQSRTRAQRFTMWRHYLTAFFCAAHLLRWASAIRLRASRLSTLLTGTALVVPGFFFLPPEVLLGFISKVRAWVRREISSSIAEINRDVSIGLLGILNDSLGSRPICRWLALILPDANNVIHLKNHFAPHELIQKWFC